MIAWTMVIVAKHDEESVEGLGEFPVGQPGLTLLACIDPNKAISCVWKN